MDLRFGVNIRQVAQIVERAMNRARQAAAQRRQNAIRASRDLYLTRVQRERRERNAPIHGHGQAVFNEVADNIDIQRYLEPYLAQQAAQREQEYHARARLQQLRYGLQTPDPSQSSSVSSQPPPTLALRYDRDTMPLSSFTHLIIAFIQVALFIIGQIDLNLPGGVTVNLNHIFRTPYPLLRGPVIQAINNYLNTILTPYNVATLVIRYMYQKQAMYPALQDDFRNLLMSNLTQTVNRYRRHIDQLILDRINQTFMHRGTRTTAPQPTVPARRVRPLNPMGVYPQEQRVLRHQLTLMLRGSLQRIMLNGVNPIVDTFPIEEVQFWMQGQEERNPLSNALRMFANQVDTYRGARISVVQLAQQQVLAAQSPQFLHWGLTYWRALIRQQSMQLMERVHQRHSRGNVQDYITLMRAVGEVCLSPIRAPYILSRTTNRVSTQSFLMTASLIRKNELRFQGSHYLRTRYHPHMLAELDLLPIQNAVRTFFQMPHNPNRLQYRSMRQRQNIQFFVQHQSQSHMTFNQGDPVFNEDVFYDYSNSVMRENLQDAYRFPYQRILFMLLVQSWYRAVQCIRYWALISRNGVFTGPDSNGVGLVSNLQHWTVQGRITPYINIDDAGVVSTVSKVINTSRRTFVREFITNLDSAFVGLPPGSQTSILTSVGTLFARFKLLAAQWTQQIKSAIDHQCYEKYEHQEDPVWVIKHVNVFSYPTLRINKLNINAPPIQSMLYHIFLGDMPRNLVRGSTRWYVFQRNFRLPYQDSKFREWVLNLSRSNSLLNQCYFQPLAYLHHLKLIPQIQASQITAFHFRGAFKEFLDYCLKKFHLGHAYMHDMSLYQQGYLPYLLWIGAKHVSLISKAAYQKRIKTPLTKKISSISPLSNMTREYPLYQIMQQRGQPQIVGMQEARRAYMSSRFPDVRVFPQLWRHQDPRQYCMRRRCLFLDIQCRAVQQTMQQPYLLCYRGYLDDINTQCVQDIWDLEHSQPCHKFVDRLYQYYQQYKYTPQDPLIIWTFNGNRYQMAYLSPLLIKRFGVVKVIGQQTSPKAYSVMEGSILFRDAVLLMPGASLAQLTSEGCYNTLVKKNSKSQIDISQFIYSFTIASNKAKIIQYCHQDCLSLMYLVFKYYITMKDLVDDLYNNVRQNIPAQQDVSFDSRTNISRVKQQDQEEQRKWGEASVRKVRLSQLYKSMTAPSIALLVFKRIFLKYQVPDDTQPQQWKHIMRETYAGGITQVTRHTVLQKAYSFDINSSYPASMVISLPWFFVKDLSRQDIEDRLQGKIQIEDLDYYVLQYFSLTAQTYPCIPVRTPKGLIYPQKFRIPQDVIVGLWGFQIRHLISNQCTFRVRRAALYSNSKKGVTITGIRDYVNALYPLKSAATDPAKKTLIKLLLNSLYGKFGQRQFETVQLIDSNYAQNLQMVQGHPTQVWHDDWVTRCTPDQRLNIGTFVRIANAITARSRLTLSKACQVCGVDNVYYVDTDSLTTNEEGRANMVRNKLLHDKQLGKWKLQHIYQEGFFIAPKTAILIEHPQSPPYQKGKAACLAGQKSQFVFQAQVLYSLKWKGVPRSYLAMTQLADIYKWVKEFFDKCDAFPGQCQTLLPYPLPFRMKSVRWVRGRGGVTVQTFTRVTNVIFKRAYLGQGRTRPLDLM